MLPAERHAQSYVVPAPGIYDVIVVSFCKRGRTVQIGPAHQYIINQSSDVEALQGAEVSRGRNQQDVFLSTKTFLTSLGTRDVNLTEFIQLNIPAIVSLVHRIYGS